MSSMNINEDLLISQLKAQIVEINFADKTITSLQIKFKNLENDYIVINEKKPNIKFEDNLQNKTTMKMLIDIRHELDNLHHSIMDK